MQFHLLARPRRWWVSLIELALVAALFFGLLTAAVALLSATGDDADVLELLSLALVLPAPFLAAWLTRRNPNALLSVEYRIRWPIVGRAALVAVPLYGLLAGVMFFSAEAVVTAQTVALACVYLLIVPFQAAMEELVFRAALPQIVGAWVRSPWVAYGAAIPPFVFLHVYNWIGLTDIFVFAVCASYLTWRTGGIEAATVLHAAGNLQIYLLIPFFPDDLTETTDLDWGSVAFTITLTLVATALITRVVTRSRAVSDVPKVG